MRLVLKRALACIETVEVHTSAGGSSNPVRIDIVVDFPEPFGPRRPRMVPGASVKLTFRIAGIAAGTS